MKPSELSYCLLVATLAAGCATAPKMKVATDPTTGQTFEYSSASDGRSWADRHPAASLPGGAVQIAVVPVLAVAAVVGVVGAGMIGGHAVPDVNAKGFGEILSRDAPR